MPAPSVLALKFLLHFVGDLHQPLHAADSLDLGGNTSASRRQASGWGTCTISGTRRSSLSWASTPRRSPPISAGTCSTTRAPPGARERPLTGRWRHSRSLVMMMPMASFRPHLARQLSARQWLRDDGDPGYLDPAQPGRGPLGGCPQSGARSTLRCRNGPRVATTEAGSIQFLCSEIS